MNRRGFLSALGFGLVGVAATSEFDWERLLWRPKPIITVPALPSKGTVYVWMDDVVHAFRNVDLWDPRDIRIDETERQTRTLGRIELEADVPLPTIGETTLLRGELFNRHKGLVLYSGNTLTVQFDGPLVSYR